MINLFIGEYYFLSNFYPSSMEYHGVWKTAEHAYQAMKTTNKIERGMIARLDTPGKAKKAGAQLLLREGWDEIREGIMYEIVFAKFEQHLDLRKKLINTFPYEIVEGNDWGDTFWGVSDGGGKNKLGKILMRVRDLYA